MSNSTEKLKRLAERTAKTIKVKTTKVHNMITTVNRAAEIKKPEK